MATVQEYLQSIISQANSLLEIVNQPGLWDDDDIEALRKDAQEIDLSLTNWLW